MHVFPQILVALVACAGVSVVKALPVDTSPATINTPVKELQNRADFCDGTTWEGQTSLGSPVVSDCLTLADRLGEYEWTVPSFSVWKQIAQWGTCAFGVKNVDPQANTRPIGNDNVRDLIRGAVERFQWNSRVGAKGVTSCGLGADLWPVEWGLYHD